MTIDQARIEAVVLKPCPFCGGPARVFQKYRSTPMRLNWRACCDNLDPIKGELCEMAVYADFETEAEAIAAWNRRAAIEADPAVAEMVDALRQIASDEIAEAMDALNTIHSTLRHRQQPQDATFHRGQKALRDADHKINALLKKHGS